jgi:hypothetical protein
MAPEPVGAPTANELPPKSTPSSVIFTLSACVSAS